MNADEQRQQRHLLLRIHQAVCPTRALPWTPGSKVCGSKLRRSDFRQKMVLDTNLQKNIGKKNINAFGTIIFCHFARIWWHHGVFPSSLDSCVCYVSSTEERTSKSKQVCWQMMRKKVANARSNLATWRRSHSWIILTYPYHQ